jgi:hypothetical protein
MPVKVVSTTQAHSTVILPNADIWSDGRLNTLEPRDQDGPPAPAQVAGATA